MISTIKKDLTLLFSEKSVKIILLFFIPILVFLNNDANSEKIYLAAVFTFTYVFVLTPFTYDTSFKTIELIASLPITKWQIVIYRYISTFLYLLISIIYSGIYLWIIDKLGISNFNYLSVELLLRIIIIVLIYLSVVFPLNFKFSPQIARIASIMLFCFFFSMIIPSIPNKNFLMQLNIDTYKYIIASFGIYIVSSFISLKLYENRDW